MSIKSVHLSMASTKYNVCRMSVTCDSGVNLIENGKAAVRLVGLT